MPLIDYNLNGRQDKVKTAIERIKAFCPITNGYDLDGSGTPKPYYVA